MSEPSSYTPRPDVVERIDTHGAIVFLAGDRALKIKRAVKLAYLDFSTLAKRRRACEREVEINRITAPGIYLRTVTITRRRDGTLEFGGGGEVVEWAVEMARFVQRNLLDRMAVEERLSVTLMTPLADHIAAYHDTAPADRSNDGVSGLKQVIGSISAALERAGNYLDAQAAAGFARDLEAAFKKSASLLSRRASAGYVRRCHGDLHLRNIVLLDGKPTLFDAIEFDEALATIDILYDLAFLLMDLWHRGEKRHANLVLNRYLWRNGCDANIDALAALPLFLSIRAGVRAMVTLDQLPYIDQAAANAAITELQQYFSLAVSFLASSAPRLIAVGGLSGTGKSTLAAGLAPVVGAAPGAFHIRSDVERKLLYDVSPEEPLGTDAYTRDVTERVYATLNEKAARALAAGHSVILDAVFAREEERAASQQVARAAGASFDGLWLRAAEAALVERVEQRRGDASDADATVVRKQLDYDIGNLDWQQIDSSGTPDEVKAAAGALLGIDIGDEA